MVRVTTRDVARFLADRTLSARIEGDKALTGQASLSPGCAGHVSFASRRDAATASALRESRSTLLIVLPEYADVAPESADLIVVDQPRREFARVVSRLFIERPVTGIDPRAIIAETAEVGEGASIGPGAVIADGCRLGSRVSIGPNAVLLAGTIVGDDVQIGPGTVIGYTGFGYAREEDGTPVLMPHEGAVVIGDRVEIGANSAIDRGTISDTVIDEDAKIDNLVHIAHNCHIGRGAFVIATAILCGGVRVGEGAWVAPNSAVREQLSIGEGAVLGLSATVIRDVPDGATVVGSPARELSR